MRFRLVATMVALVAAFPLAATAVDAPEVHAPVRFGTSPPLREIIRQQQPLSGNEVKKPYIVPNQTIPEFLRRVPRVQTTRDLTVARGLNSEQAPDVGLSFDGYNNQDNITVVGGQVAPPDTNGDVGQNFYIQYINLGWKIFNKSDGSIATDGGPFAGNTFWTGFGGACEAGNAGDPIVLYDELADRWLFSQFANPASAAGSQCFAVSTTDDPLGPYNLYEYAIPGIDYPKIGIFDDASGANSGYYLTTNNFAAGFTGVSLIAADRTAMLNGDPTATFIEFNPGTNFFAVQPGHLEGSQLPPAGTCNVFVMGWDDEIFASTAFPTDGYLVWEMCPDFATPGDSVLSPATLILSEDDDWDQELCGFGACIPQPGTAQLLDTLSQFTMYRAAMRYNPVSAPGELRMVISNTVDIGGDQAGLRWAELEVDGTSTTIVDEGTYAPADAENRWLPSIAMDISGNIAMGYSKGSAATPPSIYFTGREATDPAGTMQAEAVCVDGGGVQTGTDRWVDYSSMSVDPSDDCTFWYTSEYYSTTSTFGWDTRVCSFSFASCGVDRVLLTPTTANTSQEVCAGEPMDPIALDVSLSTGGADAVDMDFANLPAEVTGSYDVDPVDPTPGSTTASISVGAAAAAGDFTFELSGTSTGLEPGFASISLSVVAGVPGNSVTLLSPLDGLQDIGTVPTFVWTEVPGASEYLIEILNFSGPVLAETTTEPTFTPSAPLEPGEYFWRVTAVNACGEASPAMAFDFTVAPPVQALVLLVDDDDNTPNVIDTFTTTLGNLAVSFDVFDTGNSDTTEPDAATLADYQAVVWFTGDGFFGATGPSAASETEIATYLDGGGCMLMSSQDWTFAKGTTTLMTDYFGMDSFGQDVSQTQVTGADLFSGLGPYSLDYATLGLSNFSDRLDPNVDGVTSFDGDQGSAGLAVSAAFNTAWTGFPFPAIPTQGERDAVMSALLLDRCSVLDGIEAGQLSGTITVSGTSVPVPGLVVTAERAGGAVSTTTAADGSYLFGALTPGFYFVSVSGANIAPVDPVVNLELQNGVTTTQDFIVDAAALAYDNATLSETLLADETVENPLALQNVGTLPLDYAVNIGSYGFGLPVSGPQTTSGHNNRVGRRSSGGLSAALTSPSPSGPGAVTSAAPGDFFISAPFPEGSPLGITMSPSGDIWVADLFSGNTVHYNESLFFLETIPHPTGAATTTGVAYDTVNGTLWWLDGDFSVLVEGTTDGTATGNFIFLPLAGLPAGVEYDPGSDAFFYVDIIDDDIVAVDRTGALLTGYPVPQTDFDEGAGLLGNGLDVIDGKLDVVVGLIPEGQATRSVVTDLFGNNSGGETPFAAVPDTFVNDVVRSRIDPNQAMYVVGNETSTIYAIEPVNLALAEQWASVDVETGTIAPASSAELTLTYNSSGLPFGDYQAELNAGGNFVNVVPGKPLGLTVESSPAIGLSLTAYLGTDGGAQCVTGSGEEALDVNAAQAVTYCVEVSNPGNTYFADLSIDLPSLGITQADMALLQGALPLAPAASVIYSFVFEAPAVLPATVDATVSSDPTDAGGEPVAGTETQEAQDAVELTQANRAPEAEDQSVEAEHNTPLDIVLSATDADGDELTFVITSEPANGVLSGSAPNVTYRPVAGFAGEDSFTFTATDDSGESSEATITITVAAEVGNTAPVANSQAVSTAFDTAVDITLSGADLDGDTLTFTIGTGPSNGALSGTPPDVTYTPDAGYTGADSFTFTANDGEDDSAEAVVSITVTEQPNDVPTADSQDVEVAEDESVGITLTGADINLDALSFIVVSGPINGTVEGAAPDLVYTPNANFVGADNITFKVNDGLDDSANATVLIEVTPVNDPPTFLADSTVTFAVGSSGVLTEAGWATEISAGPNEDDQLLAFDVAVIDDASALLNGVSVNSAGDLVADLTGATGEATIEVTLRDDGTGSNVSEALSVVIRVPSDDLFSSGFE